MSSVTYTLQERNCNKVRNHSMTRKRNNEYKRTDCIMQMRLLEFNKILDSLESPQNDHYPHQVGCGSVAEWSKALVLGTSL